MTYGGNDGVEVLRSPRKITFRYLGNNRLEIIEKSDKTTSRSQGYPMVDSRAKIRPLEIRQVLTWSFDDKRPAQKAAQSDRLGALVMAASLNVTTGKVSCQDPISKASLVLEHRNVAPRKKTKAEEGGGGTGTVTNPPAQSGKQNASNNPATLAL
jgi:hypothetical protein